MTDAQAELLKGKFINEDEVPLLIEDDTDGIDLATGAILFKYRRNILDHEKMNVAYKSMERAVAVTEGRGTASGSSHFRVRKDGTVGKMLVGNKVEAGLVGYMDRNGKQPYCRKTAFTRDYFDKFQAAVPFIQEVDSKFAELIPNRYANQRGRADATNRNYVIKDTAFTTVTINRNFRTAIHQDAGDLREGFGNLSVINNGNYKGGYFALPQYGAKINMRTGDLLLVDVHNWHGNTELIQIEGMEPLQRISFVMYYRENMINCAQPKDELRRIKLLNGSKSFEGNASDIYTKQE